MAFITRLVLINILTVLFSGALTIATKGNICGDLRLEKDRGSIRSPNYPHPYPNATDCTWTIVSQQYYVLTLVLKDLDIEDDSNCEKPPCCIDNVLILPKEEDVIHVCGRNKTTSISPIHLSELETKIRFRASLSNKNSRGFLLAYFIEPYRTELCPPGEASCPKNSDRCYFPPDDACDGENHCPDGEDEFGCEYEAMTEENKNTKIVDNCGHQSLWCDGNYACDLNSDEDACLRNSVVSATIMGCLFCGLVLVTAMMCGLRIYTMNNSNTENYRVQLPPQVSSRLSLTRYMSLPEMIDDDYFHREPPPSYSIAVGQSNDNIEALSSFTDRRQNSWRHWSNTPPKPPTSSPSTGTSNQSSPSRDSITSSSYLSNDDNIRLVNHEN